MTNGGMYTEDEENMINIQELLDFQIRMEERISRIYERMAGQFSSGSGHDTRWVAFWKRLAIDEANHAALLSLEKEFLRTGVHLQKPVEINSQALEEFDLLLQKYEEKIGPELTRKEAIGILVSIETSEVDSKIFSSLLGATDSRILTQFTAMFKAHLDYIKWVLEETRKFEIREEE